MPNRDCSTKRGSGATGSGSEKRVKLLGELSALGTFSIDEGLFRTIGTVKALEGTVGINLSLNIYAARAPTLKTSAIIEIVKSGRFR